MIKKLYIQAMVSYKKKLNDIFIKNKQIIVTTKNFEPLFYCRKSCLVLCKVESHLNYKNVTIINFQLI